MRVQIGIAFCIFVLISTTLAEPNEVETPTRDKKLFSLFSIVTFPNQGCASQDSSARNGTCYTSSECQNKGGTSSGNCAAGFGVCCLFIVSSTSTTISENCTYIQNPSYPSVYSDTSSLTYTINKCSSSVCAVRLDFETFQTAGPAATTEASGGLCVDSFKVSGTSGLSTPIICGSNAGQHIYMEMGNSATDTATLAFTFSGTSTVRTWELKATQIPCGSPVRPPDGCLQYHTTLQGRFQTFNFAETTTLSHLDATKAKQDDLCTSDWVGIDGVSATCTSASGAVVKNRLCGHIGILNIQTDQTVTMNSVCDCVPPFNVQIYTDASAYAIAATQRGVCLEYEQVPCGAGG